jgi:hypothetical protein
VDDAGPGVPRHRDVARTTFKASTRCISTAINGIIGSRMGATIMSRVRESKGTGPGTLQRSFSRRRSATSGPTKASSGVSTSAAVTTV